MLHSVPVYAVMCQTMFAGTQQNSVEAMGLKHNGESNENIKGEHVCSSKK